MKKWIVAFILSLSVPALASAVGPGGPIEAHGNQYIQGIWTKGNPLYFTQGALFRPSDLSYDRTVTEVAVLYHPNSAGSLIKYLPDSIQPFLPPESWACTIGGGYAPSSGGGSAAFGCGLNLLDSVRGWVDNLAHLSSNPKVRMAGALVGLGDGRVNPFVSYQWVDSQTHPGRFAPRFSVGLNLGF